jgi:hypothetical protein
MKILSLAFCLFTVSVFAQQPQYMKTLGTYFGNNSTIEVNYFDIDNEGNTYLAGTITQGASASFITADAYQPMHGGGTKDVFIVKLNSNFIILWATYYGGENEDIIQSIKLYGDRLYILGYTDSSQQITSSSAYQTVLPTGLGSLFLACFTTMGNRIWSTYFSGNNGTTSGYSNALTQNKIICDNDGNIYITFASTSTNLTTQGVFQTQSCSLSEQSYIAKFTNNGFPVWCSQYGCKIDNNAILSISSLNIIDNQLFVYGFFQNCPPSVNPPFSISYYGSIGSLQEQQANCRDTFLASFDIDTGQRNWGTYYGNSYYERISNMKTNNENIYIALNKAGTGMATTGAFFDSPANGYPLLSKLSSSGSLEWASYYNIGINSYTSFNISSFDNDGSIYISGSAAFGSDVGTTFFQDSIYTTPNTPYTNDGFISKINSNGMREWGTYIGGEDTDVVAYAKKIDSAYFVIGFTRSVENIATSGAYQDNPDLDPNFITSTLFLIKLEPNPLYIKDFNENNLNIFPTITNDFVNISSSIKYKYDIYDISGKKLFSSKKSDISEKVDFSIYASGIYFISIQNENKTLTTVKKIIKY